MNKTDIVIIGAGPIGLAMAVRLVLKNIPFVLIEKGPMVGWNMIDWGHVDLFTSWTESIDPVSHELLKQAGYDFSINSDCPSGKAFATDYLSKVAALIPSDSLLLKSEVTYIDYHPKSKTFDIVYNRDNKSTTITCKTLFDASGTWGNFNQILSDQHLYSDYVHSIIPDAEFIKSLPQNSSIAVVGSGHSAMNSLIELSKHSQYELSWLVRNESIVYGKSKVGGKSENLESQVANLIANKSIELVTSFEIESISLTKEGLCLGTENHKEPKIVSHLVSNIGSFPDYSFLSGVALNLDKTQLTAPQLIHRIDPSLHSCDTVSYDFKDTILTDVPYFVIGMKSFGKASNFLLSKGYKILDQLMAHLNYQ